MMGMRFNYPWHQILWWSHHLAMFVNCYLIIRKMRNHSWLVVFTILKNMKSQWEGRHPIWNGKKNVPNHQPDSETTLASSSWASKLTGDTGPNKNTRHGILILRLWQFFAGMVWHEPLGGLFGCRASECCTDHSSFHHWQDDFPDMTNHGSGWGKWGSFSHQPKHVFKYMIIIVHPQFLRSWFSWYHHWLSLVLTHLIPAIPGPVGRPHCLYWSSWERSMMHLLHPDAKRHAGKRGLQRQGNHTVQTKTSRKNAFFLGDMISTYKREREREREIYIYIFDIYINTYDLSLYICVFYKYIWI